jgi:putative membrane protein
LPQPGKADSVSVAKTAEASVALDWVLASLHHLAVFALAGVLAYELAATAGPVDAAAVKRLAAVDAGYGALAALVLAAGLARVFLGAKGPAYYGGNSLFWAKMAAFAAVGALSAYPTLQYLRWRRGAQGAPPRAVARVRRVLWLEIALFATLPVLAAAMARGYGA